MTVKRWEKEAHARVSHLFAQVKSEPGHTLDDSEQKKNIKNWTALDKMAESQNGHTLIRQSAEDAL